MISGFAFAPLTGGILTSTAEQEANEQWKLYLEKQTALMTEQLEAQAQFQEAQIALQQEQMAAQEAMTELSSVEATKSPNDFVQANPADTKRKQLLRRGLMSTFTRYAGNNNQGQQGAKADRLGG